MRMKEIMSLRAWLTVSRRHLLKVFHASFIKPLIWSKVRTSALKTSALLLSDLVNKEVIGFDIPVIGSNGGNDLWAFRYRPVTESLTRGCDDGIRKRYDIVAFCLLEC